MAKSADKIADELIFKVVALQAQLASGVAITSDNLNSIMISSQELKGTGDAAAKPAAEVAAKPAPFVPAAPAVDGPFKSTTQPVNSEARHST